MIKYICRPATKLEKKNFKENNKSSRMNTNNKINKNIIWNKENFQVILPTQAVAVATTQPVNIIDREVFKKDVCPSFYYKKDDICCPVPFVNGICKPDRLEKTKASGMPICALNYEAALEWGKQNDGAVIRLCTELPPASPPIYRKIVPPKCDKKTERIGDMCYIPCPKGFRQDGTKCIPETFDRKKDAIKPPCPKNATRIDDKCYQTCPFGYVPNDIFCVPAQLTSY